MGEMAKIVLASWEDIFHSRIGEAFLSRFWLENEILFAKYDSAPPPDVDPRFIELYSQ